MIITEKLPGADGLVRTYSDIGMFIIQDQTGNKYSEAIDIENSGYTYTESDEPYSEATYAEKFSVISDIRDLKSNVESLTTNNNMLTECILEMSEIIYK